MLSPGSNDAFWDYVTSGERQQATSSATPGQLLPSPGRHPQQMGPPVSQQLSRQLHLCTSSKLFRSGRPTTSTVCQVKLEEILHRQQCRQGSRPRMSQLL